MAFLDPSKFGKVANEADMWKPKSTTTTTTPSKTTTNTTPSKNTTGTGVYASQTGAQMSAADINAIAGYGNNWSSKTAEQKVADHAAAEAIRNKYGFSGGVNGSQYITSPVTQTTPTPVPQDFTPVSGLSKSSIESPTLRGAGNLSNLYGGVTFDEAAIKARFDDATKASYAAQRAQYDALENKYYDQMNVAGNMALDTIRKSNAQAVATGASKGIQAANELSSVLGLEQTANTTATTLANNRALLTTQEQAAIAQNGKDALTTSNAAKMALGNLDAALYGTDTQLSAAQMQYLANLYTAQKSLEGTKYAADQSVKASQGYSSDAAKINATASNYAADKNAAASNYAANANASATRVAAQSGNSAQSAYYNMLASQEQAKKNAPDATQAYYNSVDTQIQKYMTGGKPSQAYALYAKVYGDGTVNDDIKSTVEAMYGTKIMMSNDPLKAAWNNRSR